MENEKIVIPDWLYVEYPNTACLCEIINKALKKKPDITLAEFAKILSNAHIEETYNRVSKAIEKQFNNDLGGNNVT